MRTSDASQELTEDIRPLFADDQIVELRALGVQARYGRPCTVSGYFDADHIAEMVAAAMELTPKAKGVYYTINPVDPNLLARRCNRVDRAESGELTSDKDIVSRRWLLVDVDPVRDSRISASDAEKGHAHELVERVHCHLSERGWPAPIFSDSGNGYHLLYRIDLPANDGGIVERCLKALAARFDNDHAKIDTSVYNPSRICKLPGTWACKGDSIPTRPHRQSKILEMPIIDVVPLSLLEALASEAPQDKPPHPGSNGASHKNGWTQTATSGTDARHKAYGEKVLEAACKRVLASIEGNKHVALRNAAFCCGHFVPLYFSFADAEGILRDAIARRGNVADMNAAWETIESGLRKGMEDPEPPLGDGPEPEVDWDNFGGKQDSGGKTDDSKTAGGMEWPDIIPLAEEPDVPEFPVDVLPGKLPQLARELSWAMNAPIDYAGVSMLALAAGTIGNTYRLRISETHSQAAMIYAALVGPPGSAKSPILKRLTSPLDDQQTKWNAEYASALERWHNADEETRGERPQLRICVSRNFTSESLALSLHYNQRGFVAPIDELSGLFASFNQYKPGGAGNDRQVYLSIWAQETINILRKNDMRNGIPPIWVKDPCLSIVGGIQPDMLASIRGRGSFRGEAAPNDGGLDRFLFCWPKVQPESADEGRCVPADLLEAWPEAIDNLLGCLHLDEDGAMTVHLASRARAVWVDFTQRHADEINSGELPEHLRGPWAKLKGYVPRLALVLHLLRWATNNETTTITSLEEPDMIGACQLVAYFKAHARKLHACIDSDPKAPGVKKVLRWMQTTGVNRFQKRDAFEHTKGTLKNVEALDGVLAVLEKHNFIRPQGGQERPGPGRKPSPWWEVNPRLSAYSANTANSSR